MSEAVQSCRNVFAGEIEDDDGQHVVAQDHCNRSNADIMYFGIIDDRVSAGKYMKSMPGAGVSTLQAGDMAIVLYPSMPGSTEERPRIASNAFAGGSLDVRIIKFSDFTLQSLVLWNRADLLYFFKSMTMSQRGMELLTDMVSVEAFPSRQAFKPRCKEEEDILESWSRLSLVEGDHSGWRLTAEGMVALDSTVACVDPQPASQLRMKPLHNYTDYELMLHLQQNGWVWKRYNAKRPLEAYKVGGPLVWATAGWSPRSVCKEYLLALVSLEALTVMYSAIDAVPHGCNRLTYVNLLKGEPPIQEMFCLGDMEHDGEEELPLAICDAEVNPALDADASEDASSEHVSEDEPEDDHVEDEGSEEQEDDHVEDEQEDDHVEDEGSKTDLHMGRSDNHRWGCFTFTMRPDGKAWVVRCPFHRLNAQTECKLQIGFELAMKDRARHQLYMWCNAANRFNRKREHAEFGLVVRSLEPLAFPILVAQRIDDRPVCHVLTDLELDALDKRGAGSHEEQPQAAVDSSEMGSASSSASHGHEEQPQAASDLSEMGSASSGSSSDSSSSRSS